MISRKPSQIQPKPSLGENRETTASIRKAFYILEDPRIMQTHWKLYEIEPSARTAMEIIEGPFKGLTARSVFVVDKKNVIQHVELIPEIGAEPNYDAALKVIDKNFILKNQK